MIYAVIDVGSNSIRLSVYKTEQEQYTRLFSTKRMAGLAGYISHGALTDAGIIRACEVLNDYRDILENFGIDETAVFATASLRNISNTEKAIQLIEEETGYLIHVLTGYEEALFGYYGAQNDCCFDRGILIDIGGGSTEIVFFEKNEVKLAQSMPIGSLGLYTKFVSKILPKSKEYEHIKDQINFTIYDEEISSFPCCDRLYGIGGTARAVLKLANFLFSLDRANRCLSTSRLTELRKVLCGHDEAARKLIIKNCPERIHTIVPGILILDCIAKKLDANQLIVSRNGVREGYLCQRLIEKSN